MNKSKVEAFRAEAREGITAQTDRAKKINRAFADIFFPLRNAHTFAKNTTMDATMLKNLAENTDVKKVDALLKRVASIVKAAEKIEDDMRSISRDAKKLGGR